MHAHRSIKPQVAGIGDEAFSDFACRAHAGTPPGEADAHGTEADARGTEADARGTEAGARGTEAAPHGPEGTQKSKMKRL